MEISTVLERSRAMLERYVRSRLPQIVKPVIDTEDIVQETFASAYKAWHRFEWAGEASLNGWLLTIARNKVNDAYRHAARNKREPGIDPQALSLHSGKSSSGNWEKALVRNQRTPSSEGAVREAVDGIRESIRQLPVVHKKIVALFHLEGLSAPEIAAVEGMNEEQVRYYLRDGRAMIRRSMGNDAGKFFSDVPEKLEE